MDFEILSTVPFVTPGRGDMKKTLPTEFVLTNVKDIEPHHFAMMRWGHSGQYWHPGGMLVGYDSIRDWRMKNGGQFKGGYTEREAFDVEWWQDYGDDGHVEYSYMATYRILFDGEETRDFWEQTGAEISQALAEKVYADREKWFPS